MGVGSLVQDTVFTIFYLVYVVFKNSSRTALFLYLYYL